MHSFRKHRSKNPSTTPRNTNISEYKQQVVNKMKCLHSKIYVHRHIFSMFHWNCVTKLSYQQMPRGLHLQLHPYLAIMIMHRQNFKSSIIIILTGVTLLQVPLVISSNIHPCTFEMENLHITSWQSNECTAKKWSEAVVSFCPSGKITSNCSCHMSYAELLLDAKE